MRKQRVWKLHTFLLYRFSITAAYLISFLPLFLSTWFINIDRTSLLWLRYLYISFFFFWVQNFYAHESLFFSFVCVCVYIRRVEPPCFGWGISISQSFFFLVQNYYALFILIWDPFFSFVCVCVYIRQASLAYHWCVCEIAWMSFQ